MTTAKHTPGPWVGKKDGVYFDTPWSIDHEDGHDASWAAISTSDGRTLALVVNDDSKRPMDFQSEEMHANAGLMASAPELLAALKQVNDCLVKCLTGGEVSAKLAGKAIETAALLIERIEGESK